jgi:hypothetical protein
LPDEYRQHWKWMNRTFRTYFFSRILFWTNKLLKIREGLFLYRVIYFPLMGRRNQTFPLATSSYPVLLSAELYLFIFFYMDFFFFLVHRSWKGINRIDIMIDTWLTYQSWYSWLHKCRGRLVSFSWHHDNTDKKYIMMHAVTGNMQFGILNGEPPTMKEISCQQRTWTYCIRISKKAFAAASSNIQQIMMAGPLFL